MNRYLAFFLGRTRYTLVHISAKTMARLRNVQINSSAQYLGYIPNVILVSALGIGMYTQWAFSKDNMAISVMAFLSVFVFISACILSFYCDMENLGQALFHLWVGCLMGVLTFVNQTDLQYIGTEKVMEALFITSMGLGWVWKILERIFKWVEIQTSLLSMMEGLECVGFMISSLFTGHNSVALVLFTLALIFHLVAIRLKSGIGCVSFVSFIAVGIFLFFPVLNVTINIFSLTCFLGRQAFQPLIDMYFCAASTTDRWRVYFNQPRLLRYLCLLILIVLEVATVVVVGHQSSKHKEWFVVLPLYAALTVVWLCFHLLYFHTCWRLLGKVTECNANSYDGTSFNRIMAAKGLRYYALLSQGIILISLATTIFVFIVGFETRTLYSLALVFMVLPIEASSLSLFWYLGNNLGGICCGYGIIAPVTSMRPNAGAKLLTATDVENMGLRGTMTLGSLQQFFNYHMVQNFGCDYSTSGLEGENLKKKLNAFFESSTQDGLQFDTYLLYYNGDVYDNGDWALADGHRLGLATLMEWWHAKSAGSRARLILVLDCLHSHRWLSALPSKTDDFVAIQTCRYFSQPDPETGRMCSSGDFTQCFVQFNTDQEVKIDWHSKSRPLRALYSVSHQWTNFTLRFPSTQEIESHWRSNFPRSLRVLTKLLALTSYSSSLCCFQFVGNWLRYLQMWCLPPKQLDTGHGFSLVSS